MLYQVAHELRTPLGCIIGMLQSSMQKQFSEILYDNIKQQYLNPALQSAKLLASLVNDLLDMAQQKAGKFKISYQRFNLKQLLEEIRSLMEIQAIQQGIELFINYKNDVPEFIESDQFRIRQIIINLLGNALKFTRKGNVTIEIKPYLLALQSQSQINFQKEKIIQISVKDTGYGIKKENLKVLFIAFSKVQENNETIMNPQGVGLGLMISNMLAKSLEPPNMNRGIEVKSEVGVGSEFNFLVLDQQKIYEEDKENEQQANQESENSIIDSTTQFKEMKKNINIPKITVKQNQLKYIDNNQYCSKYKKKKLTSKFCINQNLITQQEEQQKKQCQCNNILIVDDQYFNILTLKTILESMGFNQIDNALDGHQAIEKVQQKFSNKCCNAYQIILMDIDMPLLNGFETTILLKKFFAENKLETIIVGCSGYEDQETKQKALQSGMSDLLLKSNAKESLNNIINKYNQLFN